MDERQESKGLTRRRLLIAAGGAAAGLGAVALPGCRSQEPAAAPADLPTDAPQLRSDPYVPPAQRPLNCSLLSFFDAHEALTVEAYTARLVPGDASDPGAREACVTHYIDRKLAQHATFATPTYFQGPFAKPAKGHEAGFFGHDVYVPEQELPRYGFQSSLTPQDAYRRGLVALDAYTRARYGAPFLELGAKRQDATIEALEATDPSLPAAKQKSSPALDAAFAAPAPSAFGFFSMLQDDTSEGLFADPLYGGNRDYAGWKLIGYPGIQRFWTENELKSGPRKRVLQGLRDMPEMHPGRPHEHALLPIQGTERRTP